MESPFLIWQENSPSPKPNQQSQPAPRTRSKKGSKPAAPKRAPQRGLGVAQLERLRIEERFKEVIPNGNNQRTIMANPYANGLAGLYPLEMGYNMVRYEGAVPVPVPEPPSNQMVVRVNQMEFDPSRCYADHCEFCVRKKRLFGESSMYANNCVDFMQMDLASITAVDQEGNLLACMERKRSTPVIQRQTKEYQFFPMYGGDRSELANPMAGSASTSSSSPSSHPFQLLDLSLKL